MGNLARRLSRCLQLLHPAIAAAGLIAAVTNALNLHAQTRAEPAAVFRLSLDSSSHESSFRVDALRGAPPAARRAPWSAPLASLVIPGSGQALLGQQRSVGYVVAEGFLLIRAVRARRDADNSRTEYRRLASEVARASFGSDRPVGPWDYYETLEEYTASGAFELSPGGKFNPETDLQTYNGLKWLQARETFWSDPDVAPAEGSPEYQKAIAFYQARAYKGSFLWNWRDHQLEQTAYIQTIKEANRSKQQLVSAVGLVAANHFVSMIDAYINVRVRRYGGAGLGAVSVHTNVVPASGFGGALYRASVTASLPLPGR